MSSSMVSEFDKESLAGPNVVTAHVGIVGVIAIFRQQSAAVTYDELEMF